jgi:Ca-activated chloride channel family protein
MFLHGLVISGRIIKPHRIAISWMAIFSLVGVCACARIVGARGQSSDLQASQTEKPNSQSLPLRVPLTTLYVSVYDRDGKFVEGLDHDAFDIAEDGARQRIAIFSENDEPLKVGLLMDTSGSMMHKIAPETEAVKRFVQGTNPQDKFFGATFDESVHPIVSTQELSAALANSIARGSTTMRDALYFGLVELKDTRNGRKALLILSDGEDNHSSHSREDIRRLVKETGAPIYGVLMRRQSRGATREEEGDEPQFLKEICNLSGGRLVEAKELSQVPDIAAEIGAELRKQYAVAYYPSSGMNGPNDVRWRKIEVKVQSKGVRGPLKVYAPSGYIIAVDGNIL